ncbi:hypothetical protein BG004_001312 [Podila humilis]|nr:hypothetical protein BG004_001312 [Podila humilis]
MTCTTDLPFCFCRKSATSRRDDETKHIIFECYYAATPGNISIACCTDYARTTRKTHITRETPSQPSSPRQERGYGAHIFSKCHLTSPEDHSTHHRTQTRQESDDTKITRNDTRIIEQTPMPMSWERLKQLETATRQYFNPLSSRRAAKRYDSTIILDDSQINDIKSPSKQQPNSTPMTKVCGFHIHSKEWALISQALFKQEAVRADSLVQPTDGRGGDNEAQALFAQYHHEIIQKHPNLHSLVSELSNGTKCILHMITVGRWLRQSHYYGFPAYDADILPTCFCGEPMVATIVHIGFDPQDYYVCQRRREGNRGCNMTLGVMDAMLSRNYAKESPILPLTPRQQVSRTLEGATTMKTPTTIRFKVQDLTALTETNDRYLVQAMSQCAPEVWESIQLKLKAEWNPQPSTPMNDAGTWTSPKKLASDTLDETMDRWTTETKPSRDLLWPSPGLASLPAGVTKVEMDGSLTRSRGMSSKDRPALKGKSIHESKYIFEVKSVFEVKEPPRGLQSKTRENRNLEEHMEQTEQIRQAKRQETQTKTDALRSANEVFRDSISRLRARTKTMRHEGMDNPQLKCRSCKEGVLDRVTLPCFHLAMCDRCSDVSKDCVVCHQPIQGMQRVYWG